MQNESSHPGEEQTAGTQPSDVLPEHTSGGCGFAAGQLEPASVRPLPAPVTLRAMIGPSIILAGLSLGSGEFVIWPFITYQSKFVFFWACLVGVCMQYVINMEITRWTLATGETAVTGFLRLSRRCAGLLLFMNFVPWILPGWARSGAKLVGWMCFGQQTEQGTEQLLAIAGMVLCGAALTLGPVVYSTVERAQTWLVGLVMLLVVVLAIWLSWDRPDALVVQWKSVLTLGWPQVIPERTDQLTFSVLLGALAFAGCGGTLNLAQSDYIKDKGYGMGSYIGRITSPFTGQSESEHSVGYVFPPDAKNLARWKVWWWRASVEHAFSFLLTCIVCLSLLSLISYVLCFDAHGERIFGESDYGRGLGFILGEADGIGERVGETGRFLFLLMGALILFTTELGVLDAVTRVGTGLVKIAYLRKSTYWSGSRLYLVLLWSFIAVGCYFILNESDGDAFDWLRKASALNGVVMFLYSGALIYLNCRMLPGPLRLRGWRLIVMVLCVLFFGFFTVCAANSLIQPWLLK